MLANSPGFQDPFCPKGDEEGGALIYLPPVAIDWGKVRILNNRFPISALLLEREAISL